MLRFIERINDDEEEEEI